VGGEKMRNWMRERNKILGICNLCRLSTVFGGEPIFITIRKGSGIDEGHRRKPSEGFKFSKKRENGCSTIASRVRCKNGYV
jgi:hypothetical protein